MVEHVSLDRAKRIGITWGRSG